MKTRVSWVSSLCGFALLAGLIACPGCGGDAATFLGAQDREIKDATQAIETARDDARRAKAHSSRGTAYSEKARYSRLLKLISNEEYERLFDVAIRDHDQAVVLNPGSAEVYFNRAQAYYDRGSGDLIYDTILMAASPATTHGSTRRPRISRSRSKRIQEILSR